MTPARSSRLSPIAVAVVAVCGALWLSPVALRAQDAAAASAAGAHAAERARILEIGRAYVEHRWTADARNVLHGSDADGVLVHTPDRSHRPDGWTADGQVNVGVPYKWGGFSSLEEFDAAVAEGRPAGELTDGKDLDASRFSVGVDCSGFVARCWDLPIKQSTRSLGRLCFELASYDELLPGDLINKYDAHAMVFVAFAPAPVGEQGELADGASGAGNSGEASSAAHGHVRVYEAAFPSVREHVYAVADLADAGFRPFRYKPLDARWVDARGLAGAETRVPPGGRFVEHGDVARGAEGLDALDDLLDDARRGDGLRHRVRDTASGVTYAIERRLASRDGESLAMQSETVVDDKRLANLERHPAASDALQRLLALREQGQPYDELVLREASVQPGRFVAGDVSFTARRVVLVLDGSLTARGQVLGFELVLDAVLSDELPLEGLLSLRREMTWHDQDGDSTVGSTSELAAYTRARDASGG